MEITLTDKTRGKKTLRSQQINTQQFRIFFPKYGITKRGVSHTISWSKRELSRRFRHMVKVVVVAKVVEEKDASTTHERAMVLILQKGA